jgi:integrase
MPKPRASKLETATSRQRLTPRRKPYYTLVSPNISLGYRRTKSGAGSWSVRSTQGGADWIKRLALADDLEPGDGRAVLSYWEAIDVARKLARRQPGDDASDDSRPVTLDEALSDHGADLKGRGGDPYNSERARAHLPAGLLTKPVALLGARELSAWRETLKAKLSPASVNRTISAVRAACELVRVKDPHRILNRHAWEVGLKPLADAVEVNNVILEEHQRLAFRAEALRHDRKLGLLVWVADETGSRPSQIVRLTCADLDLANPVAPRLRMPKSAKGGTSKRAERRLERVEVPITRELALELRREAAGRAGDAPLLTRTSGQAWGFRRNDHYRQDIREIVSAIGLDPDVVTLYSLRHSYIVHSLKLNVPIRIVAALVDSSVAMIEKHYSKHIARHSDEIARRALLQPASDDNVIPLAKG